MTSEGQLEWRNKVLWGSGLLSLFLSISISLGGEIRENVSLALISSYLSLFIINIALELRDDPDEIDFEQLEAAGIKYDRRSKINVIGDLRNQGINAYSFGKSRYIYQDYFEKTNDIDPNMVFPLGGISKVVSVECNETGEWLIFDSDKFGFNNKDTAYDSIPPDILIVGDSFAFGSCVKQSENISGQLQKGGHSVISMGVTGSGPLSQLATLKEYGPHLKPKSVVWVYYNGNDLRDLLYEKDVPILMEYFKKGFSQNLVSKQKQIDLLWKNFMAKLEKKKKFGVLKPDSFFTRNNIKNIIVLMNIRKLLGLHPKTLLHTNMVAEKSTLDLFKSILMESKASLAKWGGNFYFVFLPGRAKKNPGSQANYKNVKKIVKELDIPFIDFQKHLFSMKDPDSFFPFRKRKVHYNPEGYKLLADFISKEAFGK